jgi:hypothetical protein
MKKLLMLLAVVLSVGTVSGERHLLNLTDTSLLLDTNPAVSAQMGRLRTGGRYCPGILQYSNTAIHSYLNGGANNEYGDDIELDVAGGDLLCYEVAIYADPDLAVVPFDFTASLYDGCPDTGSLIAGTTATWTVTQTGVSYLETTLFEPVAIPQNVYMVVSADTDNVGWIISGAAEFGFTDDTFGVNDPPWSCNYFFGGDPYAGFYARLFLDGELEPCVECPPEGVPEGEPPCGPDYIDNFNGGCNSNPPVFQPIACGDTICGESGVYAVGEEYHRDTDWYTFTIDEYSLVEWEAYGEAPMVVALIDPVSSDCQDFEILVSNTSQYCSAAYVQKTLAPGTYWAFVSVDTFSPAFPCDIPYVATLACSAAEPESCHPDTVFGQPYVGETVYTVSDHGRDPDSLSADDFYGLTDPLISVEWWGVELQCCWSACSKTDLDFVVTFYETGSLPGAVVHQETITSVRTQTPLVPFGNPAYGYVNKYSVTLAEPLSITDGWISIVSVDSGDCWFLWADGGENLTSEEYVQDTGSGWAAGGYNRDLAFCLVGESAEPTPTPTPDCIHHGDVNFDGVNTAGDAQMAFNITLGIHVPTFEEHCAADCNGDGVVTAGDAQLIFYTVLGLQNCVDPL